jgi:hypothetical protein
MALAIDSPNPAYINLVQTALDTLMGQAGALTYTAQNYGGEITVPVLGSKVPLAPVRSVIVVTEGPFVGAAQAAMPHSATLVRRVIASQHWTRIIHDNANDCTPDKWLKDALWSGIKGYIPGVHADQGFMHKVLTTGSSSVARWSGLANTTADLAMMGTIRMLNVASYILLAHELIHADRISRGLLLTGIANSTFLVDQRQTPNPLGGPPVHRVAQPGFTSATVLGGNLTLPGRIVSNVGNVITSRPTGQVWLDGTMERAEEIATVGLSDDGNVVPNDPLAITENMIRAEHGVNKRLKYGAFNRQLA